MTQQHPITPSPELIAKWASSMCGYYEAACWGADVELEACCEVLARELICDGKHVATDLRAIRRPKPPSLKELAELALSELNLTADPDGAELSRTQVELIRNTLKAFLNE